VLKKLEAMPDEADAIAPMVMWGKHDEARNLLRETIAGLQQIESLKAAEAKAYNSPP
jgi:DUF438 domain-containing protein